MKSTTTEMKESQRNHTFNILKSNQDLILGHTAHETCMKQPMLPSLLACKVEGTLEQNEPQNHHDKCTEK